jgi:Beta-galactosidase
MLVGLRNSSACCHDLKVLGFERSGAIGCSVVLCIDGLHVTTQVGLFIVWQDKIFCYCRYSQRRFVAWLKGRYGSLEELNRAWYRAYSSWEDVTAPVRFGTYPDMIDWRLFWLENLAGWLEQRVRAVKEVAPDKVAMTHVPFSGYFGELELVVGA